MDSAAQTSIFPLKLINVSYQVGGVRLIKDLNTAFEAGSLAVILGPNGAGKSLLLRLCHGLLEPSSGDISWHGATAKDARQSQAMVFQRPTMLRRSVTANLNHGLKHRGVPRALRRAIAEEMLERTGLTRLARVPARSLSVGEQQRLAVARAWSLNPDVLFMDEPTAALDPAATHSLEEIIGQIRQSGTTIIMSTHDLGQARRLADVVLFMYRGRLLERAPAECFFEGPKNDLAEAFLRGELLWWNRKELKPPETFKIRWQK
ncbi:MAG: ATP-binding cassette domain-containing protein [Rhodospirillales bacterium]|nr:ATP-binding cassette domain-containing protein [Rhodospirillales bacterium]